mgnify:CR=1 FL=1
MRVISCRHLRPCATAASLTWVNRVSELQGLASRDRDPHRPRPRFKTACSTPCRGTTLQQGDDVVRHDRGSAAVAQMDQRIGPPLRVVRRAADLDKAHPQIEPERLRILCIDVGTQPGMSGQRMLDQQTTDTGTARSRIDEECVHMVTIQQHETHWPVLGIGGDQQRRVRQHGGNLGVDGAAVLCAEEIMGGVDRAAPELDQLGTLLDPSRTKVGHMERHDQDGSDSVPAASPHRNSDGACTG